MTPFNAMAAYNEMCDENRRLFEIINKLILVGEGMADKHERNGVDVTTARAVIAQARVERFEELAA